MNQSGSSSEYGIKSILCLATHSLGVSQGLWGQRAGLVSQYGSMLGAGNQQVRNVMVEVTNDNLERAIRKMKRRLKDDNGIKLLRERQYFRKPSELKVLARKERDKRIAEKAFRAKLKWITARQAKLIREALLHHTSSYLSRSLYISTIAECLRTLSLPAPTQIQ
ncbi:hypothetical protein KC19_VG202200 [Ceratodon purpureus]|uniref:Ribosomal protein S21 n=1 Tax=Ceratodon purpureus TaxID=3225 RepID=A0A8T0HRV9_CERPU|nr:hypothetical protein KC19_VG202200 [Ceratodon purpureus]